MTRRRLDFASVIGLACTIAVVAGSQWLEGGALRSLLQGSAALIVFGGTAAALFVSFPIDTLRRTFAAVSRVFVAGSPADIELVARMTRYAVRAKRRGLLALEQDLRELDDPFLSRALELVIDGHEPEAVRHALDIDTRTREEADEENAAVLESAAGYAPTFGILGAVLGLIHVMENLAAPSKLGAGIAVAFVATVYGVGSANLLFMPLATRIRAIARADALGRAVIIEGVSAIRAGVHPRIVEQQLMAYIAAREQAAAAEKVA